MLDKEKTMEFLLKCKENGYERVAIGVEDERVPISVKIKKHSTEPGKMCCGAYWGGIGRMPPKVVCGWPEQLEDGAGPKSRPKMWRIPKECGLTSLISRGGYGCGDSHEINSYHSLVGGYYDLADDLTKTIEVNCKKWEQLLAEQLLAAQIS